MTLTDAVNTAVASQLEATLAREARVGVANRVDFEGPDATRRRIRVELERRREDPVNNVVKAWRQAVADPAELPFTLIHVFSGFYQTRTAKRENAVFVGHMMVRWAEQNGRAINYIPISIEFEPPAGDADPNLGPGEATSIQEHVQAQLARALAKPLV